MNNTLFNGSSEPIVPRAAQELPTGVNMDQVFAAVKNFEEKWNGTDWKKASAGQSANKDFNKQFDLYIRERDIRDVVKQFKKINRERNAFRLNLSLQNLRPFDAPTVPIGYHCTFFSRRENGMFVKEPLCWSFCIYREETSTVMEYVFFRKTKRLLSLDTALGRILDDCSEAPVDIRKVRCYTCLGDLDPATGERCTLRFSTAAEAKEHAQELYSDGRSYHTELNWTKRRYPDLRFQSVTLLCHTGKNDLHGLELSDAFEQDVLSKCRHIQDGVISTGNIKVYPKSLDPQRTLSKNIYRYPVQLSIRDTVCLDSRDRKEISNMGYVVGISMEPVQDTERNAMVQMLQSDPLQFLTENVLYCLIPLIQTGLQSGFRNAVPVTIPNRNMHCHRPVENPTLSQGKQDQAPVQSKSKFKKNDKTSCSEWDVLYDCVIGHRAGLWTIPKLDELHGAERNEWISKYSRRPFTTDDWKNAGRPARQKNLLPKELLCEKLIELQADAGSHTKE